MGADDFLPERGLQPVDSRESLGESAHVGAQAFRHDVEVAPRFGGPRVDVPPEIHDRPADLLEPLVDLLKPPVDLLEPPVDLLEPPVHLLESSIHLLEPLVNLLEPSVDAVQALIDVVAQGSKCSAQLGVHGVILLPLTEAR
jgi:hypothetical protein